jgi:hypothetical protein
LNPIDRIKAMSEPELFALLGNTTSPMLETFRKQLLAAPTSGLLMLLEEDTAAEHFQAEAPTDLFDEEAEWRHLVVVMAAVRSVQLEIDRRIPIPQPLHILITDERPR